MDKDELLDEVKSIWDNGGKTLDRYTIVLFGDGTVNYPLYECFGMSDNPTHPLGFSQYSTCMEGKHLGELIQFDELPEEVQKHLLDRLTF